MFYPYIEVGNIDLRSLSQLVEGKYLPFNHLPEPDGGKMAMALSENGNSQIFITRFSVAISVQYTPDWQKDPGRGKQYLLERVPLVTSIVERISARKPLYVGSSVEAGVTIDGDDPAAISAIQTWSGLPTNAGEFVSDLGIRKSTIEDGTKYLNINVVNYRDFSLGVMPSPQLRLNNDSANSRGITINVDYNNRYAFNVGKSVEVHEESVGELVSGAFRHAQGLGDAIEDYIPN